jgi:hypothetical protein
VNKIVLDRLFESFGELERALRAARLSFAKREGAIPHILSRLENYEQVLVKQRALAQDLVKHVADENWQEVERLIRLINSYSLFIRDDAKEVVGEMQPPLSAEEREVLLC